MPPPGLQMAAEVCFDQQINSQDTFPPQHVLRAYSGHSAVGEQANISITHNTSCAFVSLVGGIPHLPATIPSAKSAAARMDSLPVSNSEVILKRLFPKTTIESVMEHHLTQTSRLFDINMADGQKVILSCAPKRSIPLMRHEATTIRSEAVLLQFIADLKRGSQAKTGTSEAKEASRSLPVLVPRLFEHSSGNRDLNLSYTISGACNGVLLSALPSPLTKTERRTVDHQLGSLCRQIASLESPTGMFGSIDEVLPDLLATTRDTSPSTKRWKTWPDAFQCLVERALRDGEDKSVLLPYESIREFYCRVKPYLSRVLTPRLLLLDAGSDTNIMVQRDTHTEDKVKLTGLRSWSYGIFGDPLLSSCFEENNDAFLEGWDSAAEDVVEDRNNRHIRLMLYQCFRAVVDIVAEYYRPCDDSSLRELLARKRLTSALAGLAFVNVGDKNTPSHEG